MNKLYTQLTSNAHHIMMAILMLVAGFTFQAKAQDASELPEVRMFYPPMMDTPSTLSDASKAYIYFNNGTLAVESKANIVQDGNIIGSLLYVGTEKGTAVLTMDPKNAANADLKVIQPGIFNVEFYELTYIKDGAEVVYSNPEAPYATVTYFHEYPGATVVNEIGIPECIKSYYPAAGNEGLMTFELDKPIVADGVKAYFEYGQGNVYILTPIDSKIAEDGMSISVDLRGKCYNVDALAPGVTFYDDFGNPCPPPTAISLMINGITCADGTPFTYETVSLDKQHRTTVRNQIFKNFEYEDLTFTTPAIKKVEFYAASKPNVKYAAINADTDMMDVIVSDAEYIESADMFLVANSSKSVIKYADIQINGSNYTVVLPDAIKAAGSSNLTIGLENVVFTANDGSKHVIEPIYLGNGIKEVLSIGSLKALEPNTPMVLNAVDGIKVTLSNDMGYTFVEDANDGLQITTEDYQKVLPQGVKITGRLDGIYLGNGVFMINPEKSSYDQTPIDVSAGTAVEDLGQLLSGLYDNRLVTLTASDDITFDVNPDGIIVVNETLPVITDFIDGFVAPQTIKSVIGVLFNDPSFGQPMLLIRDVNDVQEGSKTINTIAELKAITEDNPVVLNLKGAKVTFAMEDYGLVIIEDETGAISAMADDTFDILSPSGYALTGTLVGTYMGNSEFIYVEAESELTTQTCDVTFGANMSIDEILNPANDYRLVTVNNSEATPLYTTPFAICLNDVAQAVDFYGTLPWDYEFPSEVKSFTGIILPAMDFGGIDFDDDLGDFGGATNSVRLIALRDTEDIEAETTGIENIGIDNAVETIYDIRGIKVDRKDLRNGLYIINGKKTMVK